MAKPSDKFLRAHHKAWDLTDKLRGAESTAVKGATREAYDKSNTEKAGKVAELRAAAVKAHRTAGDVAAREGDHDRAMTHGMMSHSLAKTFNPETPTSAAVASHRLPDRPAARALKASNLAGHVQEKLKARADAAKPKGGDIVDVAADAAAKAYSKSYTDARGKGSDEKTARTTAHQARQEAHKQAISEHLSQGKPKAAHDPAHAARRAEAERATAHKLDKIGEDLHEQHLSGEKSAEQINEEHALHKERLIKEHLEKSAPAAPKSAQEQHAEKLKTFAASGKAAESSKRVGQMLTSRKMTAAVKSPGEKQAPIQTSARGAKFYVSRAGEKVYVK